MRRNGQQPPPSGTPGPEPKEAPDRTRAGSVFREALEHATDAIGMSTPQGRHYYQNKAFSELFGEIGEDPPATLYCDRGVGEEVFRTIAAGGTWVGEVAMYARDRSVRYILLRAYATRDEHGNVTGLVGIHTDLTDRKRSEEAIRESERRLRALSDNLPGGLVYQIDSGPDGTERRFTYISDGVEGLHEMSAAEALRDATRIYAQIDEEDRALVREGEAEAFRRMSSFQVEIRLTLPSGKKCWRLFASAPRRLPDGRLVWDGVELDMTERRIIEQRIRSTIESSPAGMHFYRLEADNRLVFTGSNPAADRLLGVKNAEFIGMSIEEAFPPLADTEIPDRYRHVAVTGEKWETEEVSYEHGRIKGVYSVIAFQTEPRQMVSMFFDVTDRRRSEEAQRRVALLEGLGTVAGGIAHDFNNLLTGVFGNLELAAMDLPPDHPSRVSLQAAHRALDSARRLTTRLLTFAKGGNPVLEAVDLRHGIFDTVQFHLAGSNVAARFDIAEDLWPVKADKGQMGEVIANLTINAREAMPAGGTLQVHARNVRGDAGSMGTDASGPFVRLVFADEGVGIPPGIIDRIFEPYFTTKQTGSGLGLSIVHGIVKRHQGQLSVDSSPSTGTTFTLLIPADTEPGVRLKTSAAATSDSGSRLRGRILLMDDEELVREAACRMLMRLGHVVESAADGREALAKFTAALRQGTPFDLVIMDLTIRGGLGGRETIRNLLALFPAAKVVVASGYSSDPIMADYAAHGFFDRLAKPYTVEDLDGVVARALAT